MPFYVADRKMQGRIPFHHVGKEMVQDTVGPVYIRDQAQGYHKGKYGETGSGGHLLSYFQKIEKQKSKTEQKQAVKHHRD